MHDVYEQMFYKIYNLDLGNNIQLFMLSLIFWIDYLLNKNKQCMGIGVFIIFAKAFNTVNHAVPLRKLKNFDFSFSGRIAEWFKNYLKDRKQRVIYNAVTSNVEILNSIGVPQGSILAPMSNVITTLLMIWKTEFLILKTNALCRWYKFFSD